MGSIPVGATRKRCFRIENDVFCVTGEILKTAYNLKKVDLMNETHLPAYFSQRPKIRAINLRNYLYSPTE